MAFALPAARINQPRVEPPLAAAGGSTGYSVEHRQDALAAAAAGREDLVTPSRQSIDRWTANGVQRKKQTGNAPPLNLRGEHQFLLVVFRIMNPKGSADEAIAFIATHSTNPRIYSREDITKRETELGFTCKAGSTTAFQAFTPRNMHRSRSFWSTAHPTGEET